MIRLVPGFANYSLTCDGILRRGNHQVRTYLNRRQRVYQLWKNGRRYVITAPALFSLVFGTDPATLRKYSRGSAHPPSKLTENDLRRIRKLITAGFNSTEIAAEIGKVSRRAPFARFAPARPGSTFDQERIYEHHSTTYREIQPQPFRCRASISQKPDPPQAVITKFWFPNPAKIGGAVGPLWPVAPKIFKRKNNAQPNAQSSSSQQPRTSGR